MTHVDDIIDGRDNAPVVAGSRVPRYLSEVYRWAYLSPRWMPLLDRHLVVQVILWGNADRLMRSAIAEFAPGDTVLQPASVYGDFSARLAARLGPCGSLFLKDVAPVQVELCRRKFGALSNISIARADAAMPTGLQVDGVCCFFLLHEVPEGYKRRIVSSLLDAVRVGGKAVFVDYHKAARWHPLRPVMWSVFRLLEPFAAELTATEIVDLAAERVSDFIVRKEVFFGGLYQKVVFERRT